MTEQIVSNADLKMAVWAVLGFMGTQVFMIMAWMAKEIWASLKKDKDHSETDSRDLAKATQENTLAITRLTVKMEMVVAVLEKVPEMEKDIAAILTRIKADIRG